MSRLCDWTVRHLEDTVTKAYANREPGTQDAVRHGGAHPPFFSWMSSWMSFSLDTVTGMRPPGNSGRLGSATASTSLHGQRVTDVKATHTAGHDCMLG